MYICVRYMHGLRCRPPPFRAGRVTRGANTIRFCAHPFGFNLLASSALTGSVSTVTRIDTRPPIPVTVGMLRRREDMEIRKCSGMFESSWTSRSRSTGRCVASVVTVAAKSGRGPQPTLNYQFPSMLRGRQCCFVS